MTGIDKIVYFLVKTSGIVLNFCENFRQSLTGIFIKMGVRYLKLEKGGEKWNR